MHLLLHLLPRSLTPRTIDASPDFFFVAAEYCLHLENKLGIGDAYKHSPMDYLSFWCSSTSLDQMQVQGNDTVPLFLLLSLSV